MTEKHTKATESIERLAKSSVMYRTAPHRTTPKEKKLTLYPSRRTSITAKPPSGLGGLLFDQLALYASVLDFAVPLPSLNLLLLLGAFSRGGAVGLFFVC